MAKISSIYTLITTDHSPLRRGLRAARKEAIKGAKRIQDVLNKINFKAIGVGAAAAAVSIGFAIKKFTDLAQEQEAVEKRLGAVLKSTGEAAGFNLDQMKKMASEMQKVTTVGDETILAGQAILATFKNIRGQAFERTTMAALDLSEVMQQDLRSSMVQLGKAMNDPIANLGALGRAGIQFTKEQKATIKGLWEAGEAAKAQEIILKELESQFGGAAKAARDTFGGAVKALGNDLGDIGETIGFALMPPIREMVDRFSEWLVINEDLINQDLPRIISDIAENLGSVAITLGKIAKFAGLRSIMGTVKQGTELSAQGLIDWDEFITSSYTARQKMVDDALEQLESFGKVTQKINQDIEGYAEYASKPRPAKRDPLRTRTPITKGGKTEKEWTEADYAELKARAVMQERELAEEKLAVYIEASNREIEIEKQAEAEKAELIKEAAEDAAAEAERIAKDQARRMSEIYSSMGESFKTLFGDVMKGEVKSFGDYATSIMESLFNALTDYLSQMASASGAGGVGGTAGAFGTLFASLFHGGGVVGNTLGGRRVAASSFVGAPRLHGGFASDEFPAILQKGETVIPKNQTISANVPVNITGDSFSNNLVNKLRTEIERVAINVLREEMR